MKTWNLDKLYLSFEDEKFITDFNNVEALIENHNKFVDTNMKGKEVVDKETLETYYKLYIDMYNTLIKVRGFISLNMSTNTKDKTANDYSVKFTNTTSSLAYYNAIVVQYVSKMDLSVAVKESDFIKEHEFFFAEIIDSASHMLSAKEENIIANMKKNASNTWSQLQTYLTSTVKVNFRGSDITLSEVRNHAYDTDKEVRKDAYYAELEAYEKIQDALSFSINSIKGEANTVTKLRGYENVLDSTLESSRLKKETLDALISSMEDYLPRFRVYLKQKAKLLGYENGLPWYDMFVPMGSLDKTYSIPEAEEFILDNFSKFSPCLHDLAKTAFDNDWIDYTPRPGKSGGAFCSNIYPLKESRILTNYTGSISDITTIAHELGHAYHGEQVFKESMLNSHYTMPVAETASTLCETIVKRAVLKSSTSKEEKLSIIEQELQDSTQVIIDIYSRYIFENSVIEGRKNGFLNAEALNNLMLDAQIKSYGDGLDNNFLNKGMWIVKGHYYSAGLSFYNFPYAFGLLFALGIYAKYIELGSDFVEDIKTLLQNTGKMTIEDAASSIGIDVTKKEFWLNSLNIIDELIEEFINLTN